MLPPMVRDQLRTREPEVAGLGDMMDAKELSEQIGSEIGSPVMEAMGQRTRKTGRLDGLQQSGRP